MPLDYPEQLLTVIGGSVVQTLPRNFQLLQKGLRQINDPRTLYIHDVAFVSSAPLFYGGSGIRAHTDIGIHPMPIMLASNDTFPFNDGRAPDTSSNAREVHWKAYEEQESSSYLHVGWNQ